MRWADYTTPEDSHASLRRAAHRREIDEVRATNRKWARRLFAPLAVVGVVVLMTAITYDGLNTGLQAIRIGVGFALVMPFLATFDIMGEAHR